MSPNTPLTIEHLAEWITFLLGTGVATLTLLVRLREHENLKNQRPTPKKADYDIALEAFAADPLIKSAFEDLKKVEIIKKNMGIPLIPEEIGAFFRFFKSGRIPLPELRRAWTYRKFVRNEAGEITRLEFRLSRFDKGFRWFGNFYSTVILMLFLGSMFLNLHFSFAMPLPIMSVLLFGLFLVSILVMTDSLNAAARIEKKNVIPAV